jgi:hypothetical protein
MEFIWGTYSKLFKMRKQLLLVAFVLFWTFTTNAQEGERLKVITGVRVNPFMMYDFDGNKREITRIHAELGAMFNNKNYLSVGYTAFANAIYNFNEYWFVGFDKKIPVSWVLAEEYMFDENKFILQSGPNFKLGNVGNAFVFLFTPVDNIDWGLKVGAFIPLNVVLFKK